MSDRTLSLLAAALDNAELWMWLAILAALVCIKMLVRRRLPKPTPVDRWWERLPPDVRPIIDPRSTARHFRRIRKKSVRRVK